MPDPETTCVLEVDDLRVWFPTGGRAGGDTLRAVEGVSFSLHAGRTLGLIGETGCGKTMTAQAILGLVPPPGRYRARQIALYPTGDAADTPVDLAAIDPGGEQMRQVRGGQVAMVFQDAAASLSPVRTVGAQLRETIRLHRPVGRREADQLGAHLLERVGLSDPRRRMTEYAHQLSGGMSQRVAIALALCGEPRVLIADEPTTALDVAVQRQIVELIRKLQADLGMAVLYITHDLGLIEDACDDVAVMYLGRIVEQAPVSEMLLRPLHPYTKRLLESVPRRGQRRGRLPTVPGMVPVPVGLAMECAFAPRCDEAVSTCRSAVPALVEVAPGHQVRCFLHSAEREVSS